MKKFFVFSLFACVLMIAAPGCGDAAPSSVTQGVEKTELEKYEEMVAKDTEEMNAAMAGGMEEGAEAEPAPAE